MSSLTFKVSDQELRVSEALVVAVKDHPKVLVESDTELGPFEKGHEYRMMHWLAERLFVEGIVEIKDQQPVTNTELSKILWREVRSNVATKLPNGFYPRFRRHLRTIKDQAAKTGKPAALREEEQALQNMRDLVYSRIQKILRLTQAQNPPITALEGLTREERELYEQVREILESWTQGLQEV